MNDLNANRCELWARIVDAMLDSMCVYMSGEG
jgi:hypothetical protein